MMFKAAYYFIRFMSTGLDEYGPHHELLADCIAEARAKIKAHGGYSQAAITNENGRLVATVINSHGRVVCKRAK